MTTRFSPALLSVVSLVAGCVLDEDEPTFGTHTSEIGCPKFSGCGDNSPVMEDGSLDGIAFHELSMNPADQNDAGLSVLRFVRGSKTYIPKIEGGSRIVAIDPLNPTIKLTGAALEQGYLELQRNATGETYRIHILHVSPVATSPTTHWIGPVQRIETYELWYSVPAHPDDHPEPRGPLCARPAIRPEEQHLWPDALSVVVFSGDRYDASTLTVTSTSATANASWFNIGCSGSALAKLHLMRHTTAGTPVLSIPPPQAQRQALLKMYTGDFCGTGHRFTEQGTPLHWTNAAGWTASTPSAITGYESANESYWDADGAICLDTHRLGQAYEDAVQLDCGRARLLPCRSAIPRPLDAAPGTWPTGALIHSVVP